MFGDDFFAGVHLPFHLRNDGGHGGSRSVAHLPTRGARWNHRTLGAARNLSELFVKKKMLFFNNQFSHPSSIASFVFGPCFFELFFDGIWLIASPGLVLLVFLRLLQGICTGGEIASVTTYITEVGAKESLHRSMMLSLGLKVSDFLFKGQTQALGKTNFPVLFLSGPPKIRGNLRKCAAHAEGGNHL